MGRTVELLVTQKPKKRFRLPRRDEIPAIMLLLPALIIVLLFSYLPMFGILMAFKDINSGASIRKGIFGSDWAAMQGFANFVEIFKTPALLRSIGNTLLISLIALVVVIPGPIILTLLLDEVRKKWFKTGFQIISYLPHFLSWATITGIMLNLFGDYGAINSIIKFLGGDSVAFLASMNYYIPIYMITTVWKGIGWGTILYFSTLAGVSPELYEAAKIDGAGRFKQVIHISLPALVPVIAITLIIQAGHMLQSNFELAYGLQLGEWRNFDVISTIIYKQGINQGQFGISTALGLLQGLVALALTFMANKLSKKISSVSMW
jgi:putative aldouronate transport system permease protein